MSARPWFLSLVALASPVLFAANPGVKPAPRSPVAEVGKPSASPALVKDFFGPGTTLETISLNDALHAALKNNLDAKIEEVGIRGEAARLRGAYGNFDPVFSFSATRASAQTPDAVDNLRSADSIVRLQQVALATQVVNSGIAAFNSTQQGIANFLNQLEVQLKSLADQGLIARSFSTINFTPTLAADVIAPKGDDRSIIVFDQKTDQAEAELRARTPLGTIISVSARANKLRSTFIGDTREIIPQYGASATVQARQPLLKDAGPNVNLAEIRIGKKNREVQGLTWRFRLENTLSNVVASYYDMQLGLADLGNKGDAITAGLQLLSHTQRRQQLGFLSPYEVQQSQVQLSFDRENLYLSKNFFLDKQYTLQRLVLPEYNSTVHRVFVPQPLPPLQVPVLNREALLSLAREKRLDYRAAIAAVEAEDVRVKFARNQRLPQLDVVGSYGWSGLDRSYSSAASQAKDGQAPQWQIGIMGSIPVGGIQPRAQYDAARARKEQALLRMKTSELEIGIGVERAIELIRTSQLRYQTAQFTTRTAKEAVRVGLGRLEEGMITNSDLLDQQRRLYDARTRELSALAEQNKSITQLWLVTGTVLENLGITLADALPESPKNKTRLSGNGAR